MAKKLVGRPIWLFCGSLSLFWVPIVLPAQAGGKDDVKQGEILFRKQCASCHGEAGKGGPGYKNPLRGSLSKDQLASFIHKSMPPGGTKPSVAQSAKIAAYMHQEFYSPIAQARNEPARVALSRLTVKQYRNAVKDLVRGYRELLPNWQKPGLKAQYFAGRDRDEKNRVIQRIDPQVKFDFGTNAPAPDKFDPRNFQIVWEGSLFAPDTGDYEIVIRSDQAVRMFLNHERTPVVDGWVRANDDREFRGNVSLLGGQTYSLYLEFSKATPGVDDSEKKAKQPVAPASVELRWKRPKRAEETIPGKYLFNGWSDLVFVPKTPFPADDRSIGYERGSDVNKDWDEATTSAALEAADYVVTRINDLAGTDDNAKDRVEKIKAYCQSFVQRAFRRPLTPDVAEVYVNRQFGDGKDLTASIKRVVVLALKSPRFLYRELSAPTDPYAVAAHLSFSLWDTIPDPELERAAAEGRLQTPDQIRDQARRLARDPRAWIKLRDFYLSWLKVDDTPDIVKNTKRYPQFGPETASDLRTSLELFLEANGWGPEASYSKLMLSENQFLNGRLAEMYGAKGGGSDFEPVPLDAGKRAGVLTNPYLLSRFAYLENSSPIHRGVLIVRSMLGRTLSPPPAAFAPLSPSLHPDLTTRQRVSLQTKNEPCNGCHSLINPVGFTLESFDAIGRFRKTENGKPIDATGTYRTPTGEVTRFKNAMDLANYLVESKEAHRAFVEKMFHHLVKQPVLAYGPQTLPRITQNFESNGMLIQDLMVDIVTATARPNPKGKQ